MRILCLTLILFLLIVLIPALLVLLGRHKADPGLLEMAKVYRMPLSSRIRYIYLPALRKRG